MNTRRSLLKRLAAAILGSTAALAVFSDGAQAATECTGVVCRSGTCGACAGSCYQYGYWCHRCTIYGCGPWYWTSVGSLRCGYCTA